MGKSTIRYKNDILNGSNFRGVKTLVPVQEESFLPWSSCEVCVSYVEDRRRLGSKEVHKFDRQDTVFQNLQI